MDGVITRTESIQSSAESKVFATVGIEITPGEIIQRYSGFKDIDMFRDVLLQNKSNLDAQKLREEKWKIVYNEIAKKGIQEIPGVIDLINKLKSAEYMLAIGSTTNLKFIEGVLKKLKIFKKFSAISSGDEVKQGKPNPDIFLSASSKLNIAPQRCLVIEDAPNGVKAAKAAGMRCIAITTSVTRDKLQEADCVIDSFDELTIDYIKSL